MNLGASVEVTRKSPSLSWDLEDEKGGATASTSPPEGKS